MIYNSKEWIFLLSICTITFVFFGINFGINKKLHSTTMQILQLCLAVAETMKADRSY